jgi:exodeoxyribonuclease VII large subunit
MNNNPKKEIRREIYFPEPISVSEYILLVNQILSGIKVKILGEVSDVKFAASGHVYFSLKDEDSGDLINCALWSSIYRICGVEIKDGMKVMITGNADIYKVRGTLTFKVKTIELAGEGALKKAYEELKKRLTEEGLFDEERKRKIPEFVQKIGVITSEKGAAIHDFTNNLGKFGFKVFLCDSRVEGQEAVEDLLISMRTMKRKNIDVLVIIRGGGSLQSLIAFDNELFVREVVNFPVPVIAGVGHHEDVTLVALASDISQSTPTAVANLLSKNYVNAYDKILLYEKKIENSFQENIDENKSEISFNIEKINKFFSQIIEIYKRKEEKIRRVVLNSSFTLCNKKERINTMRKNIFYFFRNKLKKVCDEIFEKEKIILTNDPKRQLGLGYAIMRKEGKIIKSVKTLKKEEKIENILSDGKVTSIIKNIKK